MLRDAASKAIPLPKLPNKEATRVALADQSIHVSMQHQHIQASRVIFVKPKPQKQKQKIQQEEFTLDDFTLIQSAVVGVEVDVRPSPGMGEGLFTIANLLKGKRVADYQGHRLFKDGSTAMFCKKTEAFLANLPAYERDILSACLKSDKWSLNVGSKPSALTNIQSSICAHPCLAKFPNRGGFSVGCFLNSSKKPNCKLVWFRPKNHLDSFRTCNYYYGSAAGGNFDEAYLELIEDVEADTELFWNYNTDGPHHSNAGAAMRPPKPARDNTHLSLCVGSVSPLAVVLVIPSHL